MQKGFRLKFVDWQLCCNLEFLNDYKFECFRILNRRCEKLHSCFRIEKLREMFFGDFDDKRIC